MKIYDEISIADLELNQEDKKLVVLLLQTNYFVRRFFVVYFEGNEDSAFLEFYTRVGFGEFCDCHLLRIPLSSGNGVILCNYMRDGSDEGDIYLDYLDDLSKRKWPKSPDGYEIDIETTLNGETTLTPGLQGK